jgi:hypothetical protein
VTWRIRYSRRQIAEARGPGKNLMVLGFLDPNRDLRAEAFLPLSAENITLLWLMASELGLGKTPSAAFEAARSSLSGGVEAAVIKCYDVEAIKAESVGKPRDCEVTS